MVAGEAVYTLKSSLMGFTFFAGLLPSLVVLCSLMVAPPGGPNNALLFLIPFGYLGIVSHGIFWLSTLRISLSAQGIFSSQSLKMPRFIRWEEIWLAARYQGCWGWPRVYLYTRSGQHFCFLESDPAERFYPAMEAMGAQHHFRVVKRS